MEDPRISGAGILIERLKYVESLGMVFGSDVEGT